jgi:hypothetical protein
MQCSKWRASAATIYSILVTCSTGKSEDSHLPVPVGNLRSKILMVQSAQNWHRQRSTDRLDGARDRRVLVQR